MFSLLALSPHKSVQRKETNLFTIHLIRCFLFVVKRNLTQIVVDSGGYTLIYLNFHFIFFISI